MMENREELVVALATCLKEEFESWVSEVMLSDQHYHQIATRILSGVVLPPDQPNPCQKCGAKTEWLHIAAIRFVERCTECSWTGASE